MCNLRMFLACANKKSPYLRDLDRRLRGNTSFGTMTSLVPGEGLSRDSIYLLGGHRAATYCCCAQLGQSLVVQCSVPAAPTPKQVSGAV